LFRRHFAVVFLHTHAGPLAAHLGAQRTLAQLRQHYYWPGMSREVSLWCATCDDCAFNRGPPTRPHGLLTKVLTGVPFDLVAIDILSGLPVTQEGYKYFW